MDKLKELEQLKKEYKEIPIPENGVAAARAAMERAMRKKHLKNRMVSFAAMAAAAVLVVAVFPRRMFFSGGAANESANVRYDTMSKGWDTEAMAPESSKDYGYTDVYNEKVEEDFMINPAAGSQTQGTESGAVTESATGADGVQQNVNPLSQEETRIKISDEIKRQLDSLSLEEQEQFLKHSALWEDFGCITEEQEYYFNTEGRLVIVFVAGEDIPAVYGTVEFIIPDEVWK